jgi:hypothetical protein
LLALATPVAHAAQSGCGDGISQQTTQRLFTVLNQPPDETDCRFEGVQTERSALSARWSYRGALLPPLRVVARQCAPDPGPGSEPFVLEVPDEIGARCPSVLPRIDAFVAQVSAETPVGRRGSLDDPLYRGARWLFVVLGGVLAALLLRGASRWRFLDASWTALGLAAFSLAVAVRAALPFSLGNWYAEVLPASGAPPPMRFGPGLYAFQSLLRDAGLWNSDALVVSQLVIGAAAVPLLLGVMRELRLGIDAAAAALLLLALAPFHARLSATSSEHVLASTLCLALLLCWLRAPRDALSFAAALLLFPAVCATRADSAVQALLVLPWPLLVDRIERAPDRWPERRWQCATMAAVALVSVAATYQLIVVPSQHPRPDWAGHLFALRWMLPQFWLLATTDPRWFSLPAVLLATVGLVPMALRRPLLWLRLAATVLVAFIAAGRTFMHDELLGARYFLFTIPIFLIAAGYGFEFLTRLAPSRLRRAAAATGIAGLALWTGMAARSAYAARYAFEDEYRFARQALTQLPAGCTVYQVAVRDDALPRDLDCCLDLPRSPLALDYPALRFRVLPADVAAAVPAAGSCAAYFEGVACAITPGPPQALGHALASRAAEHFGERCARVHNHGRLVLLAETATSARTTEDLFFGRPPRARLYRWEQ